MFSGLLAPERHARDRRVEHRVDDLLGRIVGVDRDHLGAVDHHVGDREVAQIEQAAEHVAVVLLDAALAVQQVDRAAQFLVRRQDRPGRRRPGCRTAAGSSAPAPRSPISTGPNSRTTQAIGRATSSAMRSGALIATRLRQHLGEDDDQRPS